MYLCYDLAFKCILKEFLTSGSLDRKGGSKAPERWLSLTGTVVQTTLDIQI